MSNIPVKWFDYRMAGGPTLSGDQRGTSGVIIGLLDAVLVNGFNTLTVDSVVVSSGTATVTRSTGMIYLKDQVIEIAGATPSGLNGQWRVLTTNAINSITFACPGISDGTATGTITIKTPSLGWGLEFTGTNRRVYRSQNVNSPRSYYHVNDAQVVGNGAAVYANASMLNIDTPVGQWAAHANSRACFSGASAHTPINGENPWFVVGDDRTAYFCWQSQTVVGSHYHVLGFGDFISFLLNDNEAEFVCSGPAAQAYAGADFPSVSISANVDSGYGARVIRKSALGVVGPRFYAVNGPNAVSGLDTDALPWPSSVHNEIVVTDILLREVGTGGNPLRGKHRGVYHCMTGTPLADQYEVQFVNDVAGLENRLCAVLFQYDGSPAGWSSGYAARLVFDLTGPW